MDEFISLLHSLNLPAKNNQFYLEALTHRSYLNEDKSAAQSNERMEFLGDSILSFITSSHLFNIRKSDNEGDLTNLRAYLVKTESLAKAASRLQLGKFLRMSKGEELSGGRENPQILANTYEATLGAIFLDQGIEKAKQFVDQTLLTYFEEIIKKGAPRDPKSELQEIVQSRFKTSPKYKTLISTGPDHAKKFTVGVYWDNKILGEGTGSSKQQAEEEAASVALVRLTQENL